MKQEVNDKITTAESTKAAEVSVIPAKSIEKENIQIEKSGKTQIHIVINGENLWTIAEKYYKSGYNWVDISRVNKLSNPSLITVGMKLSIPDVNPKTATVVEKINDETVFGAKITGTTYTIKKGDHLWGVAVRAFNDGYKWVEIARVNNINNPDLIQPGLVLKLPRTTSPAQK